MPVSHSDGRYDKPVRLFAVLKWELTQIGFGLVSSFPYQKECLQKK